MATNTPLTFTAVEANSTIKLIRYKLAPVLHLEYSTDGQTWQTFTIGTTYTLANAGDYLMLRAPEGNPNIWGTSDNTTRYHYFQMTGKIAASGNIMSLYDKDGVTSAMSSCGLMALFFNCTSLTTPPELPATSFAADCYSNLFRGCSSLEYVKTAMTSEQLASGTYTSNWLANVASTGTYESTDPDFDTSIARGVNTVPAGWNIVKPGPPENPFRKFFIDGKEVSELFVDGHEVKLADAPMALKGLAFKAKQDGSTVALTKIGAPVDVSLEYAVNSNEDEDFQTLALDTPVALDEGDVMLVRAPEGSPNLSGFCQTWADGNQHHSFDIRGRVDMAGDVTRLLQKQGAVEALPAYCFVRMFTPTVAGQYGLEDCSGAYVGDVTANGQSVFSRMFEGCTSLTKAPRWGKVSILGESAYTFQYCFYNCSNLTEAQDVFDASGTGNYTFQSMFENCTSLLHGPQLGSGAVDCGGRYSHQSAFKGCTAMTSAGPVVQIDRCWRWKYEQMFRGCTSLEEPPEMRVSDGSQYAFQYMFADCTSLKRTASFRLGGYHDGFNSAFASMYVNCASLTSITEMPVPPDWSGGNAQNYLYVNMFSGCSSLVDASDVVLSPYLNQYSMCAMFKNCTSLEKPPQFYAPISGMFQNAMQEMFMGCASLTSTPAIDETAVQSVSNDSHNGMFTGCSALVDASGIKLSEVATVHGNRCYYEMFKDCTSLANPPEKVVVSSGGSYISRMHRMFNNCPSLAESPMISCMNLHNYDMSGMFDGCTSLSNVTAYVQSSQLGTATNKSAGWLNDVASEGRIFVPSGFDVTIARGPDTVPEGWRIYVPTGGEDVA